MKYKAKRKNKKKRYGLFFGILILFLILAYSSIDTNCKSADSSNFEVSEDDRLLFDCDNQLLCESKLIQGEWECVNKIEQSVSIFSHDYFGTPTRYITQGN